MGSEGTCCRPPSQTMAKLGMGGGDEAKPGSIPPLPTWLFTNYLVTVRQKRTSFSGQRSNLNRNKDITFPDVFTPFQRLKNRMTTTTIRQSDSCHWGRPMSWIPLLSCRCRTPRLPGGEGRGRGDGGVRQDDRGCGTTGQSPQALTDGDWPWAAPATAPHCVGLSCTAVASAGDGPSLGQQIICQILPAHLCFQNSNTNLLSATSMLVLGRWWEITGKFRPFKNSQRGAVVLNRSNGVTLNLQPGGQCCVPGIWRIVTGIILQRTGQPLTARNHPIPNVHVVEFKLSRDEDENKRSFSLRRTTKAKGRHIPCPGHSIPGYSLNRNVYICSPKHIF